MGIDMELEVIFRIEYLVTESAGVGVAARKVDAFNVLSRNQKIFQRHFQSCWCVGWFAYISSLLSTT
jgi:hypothetical protein